MKRQYPPKRLGGSVIDVQSIQLHVLAIALQLHPQRFLQHNHMIRIAA